MRPDYKVLSITIFIFTCIYVVCIFQIGVDANSTQPCIQKGERWIGWECLPRENPSISKRCPTPLTHLGGCESGQFPRVQPFPNCPNRKLKPSCSLVTVRQKDGSSYKERNL